MTGQKFLQVNFLKLALSLLFVLLISNQVYAQDADTQPPSDVPKVRAVAGDTKVTLTWGAATDNVGVTGYKIYMGKTPVTVQAGEYEYVFLVGDVNSYEVTELLNDTAYYFAVTAVDAANKESEYYSDEVKAIPSSGISPDTESPSYVENVQAVAGDTEVTISWKAATDNVGVAGYKLFWGTAPVTTEGGQYQNEKKVGNTLSYELTGLTNDAVYYFAITALDAADNESLYYSDEKNAKPIKTVTNDAGNNAGNNNNNSDNNDNNGDSNNNTNNDSNDNATDNNNDEAGNDNNDSNNNTDNNSKDNDPTKTDEKVPADKEADPAPKVSDDSVDDDKSAADNSGDTTAPKIVTYAVLTETKFQLIFSEDIETDENSKVTVTETASGAAIKVLNFDVFASNQKVLMIETAKMKGATNYTVVVNKIADLNGNLNKKGKDSTVTITSLPDLTVASADVTTPSNNNEEVKTENLVPVTPPKEKTAAQETTNSGQPTTPPATKLPTSGPASVYLLIIISMGLAYCLGDREKKICEQDEHATGER